MGDRKARLASLAARAGRTKLPTSSEDDDVGANGYGDGDHDEHERPSQNGELNSSSEMGQHEVDTTTRKKPLVSFRNYTPKDTSLETSNQEVDDKDQSSSEPPSKRQRTTTEAASNSSRPIREEKAPSTLAETLAKAQREISHITSATNATAGGGVGYGATSTTATVDIKALGPEKINGDLKRGIQDKLAKLERRTQKVIVELLKERLEREASQEAEDDDANDEDGDDVNALD